MSQERVGAIVEAGGHGGRALTFGGFAAVSSEPIGDALDPRRLRTNLADLALDVLDGLSERVDETLLDSLERLTRTLGVDRSALARFTDGGRSLLWAHGFAMPGIPAGPTLDFSALLPWLTDQIRQGRPVVLRRLPDDLPFEATAEADFAARVGLKSNLTLPLKADGEVLGALGLGSVRAFRSWTPEIVSSLELVASAFASVLLRQRSIEELGRTKADLEAKRQEVRDLEERLEAEMSASQSDAVLREGGFDDIVGTSAGLFKVLRQMEQVAAADSPVLILGETGTGKDLVARGIHGRSRRQGRPLVSVNCAALPEALIESELFGCEKGAFTGAVARTLGRFETADGGSILLDEIGELALGVQAKLLRVLEAGTFERLGSSKTIRVNVRVLAATNRDLERAVREGRFRADLFYRLNVFPITVPPLRERVEDIPLLAWHFINAKQGALGRSIQRVPDRLMRALETYEWPGNIRELENVIERALIVTNGPTLAVDALFLESAVAEAAVSASLDDVQRAHIEAVLRQCAWKVAGKGNAAERLGMKRGTLQSRMKRLGILRPGAVAR